MAAKFTWILNDVSDANDTNSKHPFSNIETTKLDPTAQRKKTNLIVQTEISI